MKLALEIVLSVFLHPIAMVLMWINLIKRADMVTYKKVVWLIVSVVWGKCGWLLVLVAVGSVW